MNRLKFILSALVALPLASLPKAGAKNEARMQNGFKVNSGEARFDNHFEMKGVTLNILDNKISSDDTGGAIAVFEQNGLTPNGGPPFHIHLFQDEFFYVIEGEYLFQAGDVKYRVKSGDTIFLPRNVPHAFIQLTEKARVLVSYLPAGKMEDFFRTTDAWTFPPSLQEIAKVFEDHEMKVVGPPLKANGVDQNTRD